jgi:hypothetical protein
MRATQQAFLGSCLDVQRAASMNAAEQHWIKEQDASVKQAVERVHTKHRCVEVLVFGVVVHEPFARVGELPCALGINGTVIYQCQPTSVYLLTDRKHR